tara:strand:- start:190 stop:510 length:321 start_codon:yes stop_codon:yes gene_type:complete
MSERDKKGQFKKGSSGNPSGRPKNQTFTKELRTYMNEIDPVIGIQRLEFIVTVLFTRACEGDLTAIKMIMDRVDGLPTQTVETRTFDTIKVIDIDDVESPDDKILG